MFIKNKIRTMLVLLVMVCFTCSCTKEETNSLDNNPETIVMNNEKEIGCPIHILTIKRGHKCGTWPYQYCMPPYNKYCWLWFQATQNDLINYPYATYEIINDSTLKLNVDFSAIATDPEVSYWQNDIINGYFEIGDTIIISNSTFSNDLGVTGDITILPDTYPLGPVSLSLYQYSVNVKFN